MSVWNKVKEGIDKAGKAAQDAFDEGKTRLEAYRAREQADKAAEALGYAVFRASEAGMELETEGRERLMRSLRERDSEAHRLETEHARGAHAAQGAPAQSHDATLHDTASQSAPSRGGEPADAASSPAAASTASPPQPPDAPTPAHSSTPFTPPPTMV